MQVYGKHHAQAAGQALNRGEVVDWQPGDGSRYECQIVRGFEDLNPIAQEEFLLIHNIGGPHVVPLTGRNWSVHQWARLKCLPAGCWAGLRPLLAAMVRAEGKMAYQPLDARREAEERLRNYGDGEPLNHADAELGRVVRRVIEGQSREGTPVPSEPNLKVRWCGVCSKKCTGVEEGRAHFERTGHRVFPETPPEERV